ncbi:MAG TPA: hypothetical protein VFK07_03330 [Candidatus Paceibacterota bacterium]|nr:hypothetical protein [Candidatus Paceibacterota bacterium]
MVYYQEKYKKNIAIDMRKRGFSYSEISEKLFVPKSTLSLWLREVPIEEEHLQKLRDRKLEALRSGSRERLARVAASIEELKNQSAESVKEISKRELWLMGIVLYWRERFSSDDVRKGVQFSSSDPALAKLFLLWLAEVGGIREEEIISDVFLSEDDDRNKVLKHWAEVVGKPSHVYVQKSSKKKKMRKRNRNELGFLRIRVKASSMLARQVAGWAKGIENLLLK